MGYFQVRYNSRVIIYDCRGFIRLATDYNGIFFVVSAKEEIKNIIYHCGELGAMIPTPKPGLRPSAMNPLAASITSS